MLISNSQKSKWIGWLINKIGKDKTRNVWFVITFSSSHDIAKNVRINFASIVFINGENRHALHAEEN